MNKQSKYYITGGAGFIGSNLVFFLNSKGITPFIIEPLDKIGIKWKNLSGADFILMDIEEFKELDTKNHDILIHLGANVTTTEEFNAQLWKNNVEFSIDIIDNFSGHIIYASSASIYGLEDKYFNEDNFDYFPLNPYAFSKMQLDKLIFKQNCFGTNKQSKICALRFFNVYGQNEQHKGNMGSVIQKWLSNDEIGKDNLVIQHRTFVWVKKGVIQLQLFKSLNPDYADGEQKRDFIYVGDVCKVIWHAAQEANFHSGIFNLGSGTATTWNTVAKNVLKVRGLSDSLIQYVDMPENLVKQYQYNTKADITKLREVLGYMDEMTNIEEGVKLTWAQLNK